MARRLQSGGWGPFFLPSLGGSNFVAMIPSLFRGSNATFLGGLHFPWLKESTFCLNYWGFHLLWNMHHSCLAQQRISLPGKPKLEPETLKGLKSSALLKYACQNNIHFQGNKFKCLGPHTIQSWRFFQSFMLVSSNHTARWAFSWEAYRNQGKCSVARTISQGLPPDSR